MNRPRAGVAFARLSAANPFPAEAIRKVTLAAPALPGRHERHVAPPRRVRLAIATVTCAVAVIAIAPALAASERVREFFGFSNQGTPVPSTTFTLDQITSLETVGFSDGVRKVGERADTAFYVGRSNSGALCFATGPANGPRPEFGVLACQGAEGRFPSRQLPIVDLSPKRGYEGSSDVYVWKLVGFAADGVAAVAMRDTTGALHRAPVVDNVYASDELPAVAATEIVALAADGTVLYSEALEEQQPG